MNEVLKNETLHTLRTRRSIRRYQREQITQAELEAILDAGTWAASGKGLQSAVMVVLQREDQIAPLRSINARILGNPAADPFYGAPTVVAVLASITGADKVSFLAVCGKEAVARGIKAGDLVKAVSAICGGKGGGKPDSAMGGGTDMLKLDDALASVDDFVAAKLG